MSKAILTGIITDIFQAEIRGSFEKRIIWIQEEGVSHPNTWAIEFQQGDANKVDGFKLERGQRVAVTVEIKGYKFSGGGRTSIIHTNKFVDLHKMDNTKSVTYTS